MDAIITAIKLQCAAQEEEEEVLLSRRDRSIDRRIIPMIVWLSGVQSGSLAATMNECLIGQSSAYTSDGLLEPKTGLRTRSGLMISLYLLPCSFIRLLQSSDHKIIIFLLSLSNNFF